MEVRQVRGSRHELSFTFENLLEVVNLKPVSKIDVGRDLLVVLLLSEEDDRRHTTRPHFVLSRGESR